MQTVEIVLTYDTDKKLKDGKRRYSDEDAHNLYLLGDEVEKLGKPHTIKLTVTPGA